MKHTTSATSCCPCWTWCLKGGPQRPSASLIHGLCPRGHRCTPAPTILWNDKLGFKILGLKTYCKQTHHFCETLWLHRACIHLMALSDSYTHFDNCSKKRDCCWVFVPIWITLVIEGTLGLLPIFMKLTFCIGCVGLFLRRIIFRISARDNWLKMEMEKGSCFCLQIQIKAEC